MFTVDEVKQNLRDLVNKKNINLPRKFSKLNADNKVYIGEQEYTLSDILKLLDDGDPLMTEIIKAGVNKLNEVIGR